MVMKPVAFAVGILMLLITIAARAQNDQGDDTQYLIDSTAADLGSPDANTAANAKKQLIGLGDAAIPAVQKVLHENRSPQAQKLGQEVLSVLESHYKIDPTLVSLKLDHVTPQSAFAEFSKIAGVRIEGQWNFWQQYPQGMPRHLSLNVDNEPFAQALYELCQKTAVQLQNGDSGPSYVIYPNYNDTQYNYPTFISSAGLFYIDNIDRDSQVNMGDKSESDTLTVDMHLVADPKLPIRNIYNNAIITEAIGDTGQSLIDQTNNQQDDSVEWASNVMYFATPNINLKFKTGQNKSIRSLKGAMRIAIPLQPTKIEFTDLTAGKSATSGTWKLTIESFTTNQNGCVLKVVGDNSQPSDSDSRGNVLPNASVCKLFDASSLPYIAQFQGGNFNARHFTMSMRFRLSPNGVPQHAALPAKLVMMFTNSVRVIRVPFEFHDLPIPAPSY